MKLINRVSKAAVFVTAVLLAGIVLFCSLEIYHDISEDRRARAENESLRHAAAEAAPTVNNKSVWKTVGSPETGLSSGDELVFPEDPAPLRVDFRVLKKANEDIIAWIYVPGTHINYPILKGKDNDYYLHRLPDKSYAAAGSLFMDFRCSSDFSDPVSIVYGHNMKNGTMFRDLEKYKSQEFYDEHPVYWLFTENRNYRVDIFAGYVTDIGDPVFDMGMQEDSANPFREIKSGENFEENGSSTGEKEESADRNDRRKEILGSAYVKSTFGSEIKVRDEECILVLSTCSYEFDNARYVLLGVLHKITA